MSTPSQRLQAIDALRGLVILIMMVDHVRETFLSPPASPRPDADSRNRRIPFL